MVEGPTTTDRIDIMARSSRLLRAGGDSGSHYNILRRSRSLLNRWNARSAGRVGQRRRRGETSSCIPAQRWRRGANSSELDTLTSLGQDAGIGVKVSNLVGQGRRTNDATIKLLPFQPNNLYVASDSTLKLNSNTANVGHHGPRIAVTGRLSHFGVECMTWNSEVSADISQIRSSCRCDAHCHWTSSGVVWKENKKKGRRAWVASPRMTPTSSPILASRSRSQMAWL